MAGISSCFQFNRVQRNLVNLTQDHKCLHQQILIALFSYGIYGMCVLLAILLLPSMTQNVLHLERI